MRGVRALAPVAGKRSLRYQRHQGDKYATPDSTRGHVDDGPLRADHRRLFMLCWAARASDVLITLLPLNDRGRFAHVIGDEHSLKSPVCWFRVFRSRRCAEMAGYRGKHAEVTSHRGR